MVRTGQLAVEHQNPRAERGAVGPDLVTVEMDVELLLEEPRERRPRDERPQLGVIRNAPAESRVVEQIAEGRVVQLHLVDARPVDPPFTTRNRGSPSATRSHFAAVAKAAHRCVR